jgi:hypothetical protein
LDYQREELRIQAEYRLRDLVCVLDGVKLPRAREPLELRPPAFFEADPGTGDQVLDGARNEDLSRPRLCGDPRTDMPGGRSFSVGDRPTDRATG